MNLKDLFLFAVAVGFAVTATSPLQFCFWAVIAAIWATVFVLRC